MVFEMMASSALQLTLCLPTFLRKMDFTFFFVNLMIFFKPAYGESLDLTVTGESHNPFIYLQKSSTLFNTHQPATWHLSR